MKILITGAFGQLGEILSKKLNNFNEVIKTGRKLPSGENGMSLDICNKIIRITSSYAHKGLIDTYATALQVFAPVGIAISVQYFSTDYSMFGFSRPLYSIQGQLAFAAFGLLSTFCMLYSLFPIREPLRKADP